MIDVNAPVNLMQKSSKTDRGALSYTRLKFEVANIVFRIVVYQPQTSTIDNSMRCGRFLLVSAAF